MYKIIYKIEFIAKKQVKDVRAFLKAINLLFEISGATNAMIDEALAIDNNDLEDNLQYLLAKKTKCEFIVTNDKTFYAKDIQTISSEAFVEKYL